MTYRAIAAAFVVFAVALTALASGGFTAMELDRNVNIEVTGTDEAAIGVEACYIPAPEATERNAERETPATPVSVKVTNRLEEPVTVESITGDERVVNSRSYGTTVEDNERFTVPFKPAPSEITVTASADGITSRITIDEIDTTGRCPVDPPGTGEPFSSVGSE